MPNETGEGAKEIYMPFSNFKNIGLAKIFLNEIGKEQFQSQPILK